MFVSSIHRLTAVDRFSPI